MLETVLKFNYADAIGPYAELGRIIDPSLNSLHDEQAARQFVERIAALVEIMPFSRTLTEAGIPFSTLQLTTS